MRADACADGAASCGRVVGDAGEFRGARAGEMAGLSRGPGARGAVRDRDPGERAATRENPGGRRAERERDARAGAERSAREDAAGREAGGKDDCGAQQACEHCAAMKRAANEQAGKGIMASGGTSMNAAPSATAEPRAAGRIEQGGMVSTKGGIVVLDFGGQYKQLIARRIREQQVFSAILPCTSSAEEIRKLEPAGLVLSGGPNSVYDAGAPVCDPKVLDLGVPVLGICYGMQWLAHTLGGKVERAARREYGPADLGTEGKSPLFRGLPARLKVWESHGDHVIGLPQGFHVTGRTENAVAAVENAERKFYGVEFHPEVNHTDRGAEILRNFVFEICSAKENWNRAGFIAASIEAIRKAAEGTRAICALSGGVDS